MPKNSLIDIETFGQSIWLDYISRSLIENNELEQLIKHDHLKGVTSNPSIFEKTIAKTDQYTKSIETLVKKDVRNAVTLYELLAIKDIQDACDVLRPVFEDAKGCDGFASLEVSPHLAFDADGTIAEGRRLWHQVDRPNLMIKVPGTEEGMKAIRALIADGINVNVTLLFAVAAYKDAAFAYLNGLHDRLEKGLPVDSVHSVASFFVSRIDTKVDAELDGIAQTTTDAATKKAAQSLLGTVAIANAKVAYLKYETIYQTDLAKNLLKHGAHPQRLLWASTGTKNKNYSDVLYVEQLIGKNTVNTLPPETLAAFRDHGSATNSLTTQINSAPETLRRLEALGIDFNAVCDRLVQEGVTLFADAYDHLIEAVEKRLIDLKSNLRA